MRYNLQSLYFQRSVHEHKGHITSKTTLVLVLLVLLLSLQRASSELGNDEDTNMDDFFDLRGTLSSEEYDFLEKEINTNHNGKRFLIGWPTIPVPYKGSDSRALDAIRFLNNAGYKVDLIFWRDFATELGDPNHNDKPDRLKLAEVGVQNIYGPYDETKLSQSDKNLAFSHYFAFIFWIWPDGPYLECVHDFVNHIKTSNGYTHIIAAVDDIGVAVRLLYSMDMRYENAENKNLTNIENFLLVNKRHPDLLGMEADDFVQRQPPSITFKDGLFSPIYLFHLEMYLYAMADVSVGLNDQIQNYLEKMVPGTPSKRLSYLSSAQPDDSISRMPFEHRKDYLFFGYRNDANIELLHWFHEHIFSQIETSHKFHIAGMVTSDATDFCKCIPKYPNNCEPMYENVVCHGPISDDELETIIRNAKVTINTVLEPSGVATKTCRSLAYGTPTVTSELDGTFNDNEKVDSGAKICLHSNPECVVNSIKTFLVDEDEWNLGATLGPIYVSTHYGPEKYTKDWVEILSSLYAKKVEILMYGDANYHGTNADLKSWHIAKILSKIPQYNVTVIGNMDIEIDGVGRVDMPSDKPKRLPFNKLGGFFRFVGHSSFDSPFETGFQANIILRKNWPSDTIFPMNYCGVGCRVTQMLPLDFGSMPEKLISSLSDQADWLWFPTQNAQNVFKSIDSGSNADPDRTSVVDEGVDCESFLEVSSPIKAKDSIVRFIFTGDLIPSNGIDIIIEEWSETFCKNNQAKLILLTKSEFGYSNKEIEMMEMAKAKCKNVEWKRQIRISPERHMSHLLESDIFLGIFRSDASGFYAAEALTAGLSLITTVGEISSDHYFMDHDKIFPVSTIVSKCTHYPCVGGSLCTFPPCSQSSPNEARTCSCERLIDFPVWFDIDRSELRSQMLQAFHDKFDEKSHDIELIHDKRYWTDEICWSKLQDQFKHNISLIIKEKRIRKVQQYEIIRPRSRKQVREFWKFTRLFLIGIPLSFNAFQRWKRQIYEVKQRILMKLTRYTTQRRQSLRASLRQSMRRSSLRQSMTRFTRYHED